MKLLRTMIVRIREFEGDGIVGAVLGDDGFETIVRGSLGSMETCQAFLGLGSKIDEAFRKRDEGFN